MEDTGEFRSLHAERTAALAELKAESARLCRQLRDFRARVDGPALREWLHVPQPGGMVAGESPSTGTETPHETPPAAGLG